jgi:formamidopyrimidine-DNA glycosylase
MLPEVFIRELTGQAIVGTSRRAKVMLLPLSAGVYLACHLMLDGHLYWGPQGNEREEKAQVVFYYPGGHSLSWRGLTFGYLHLLSPMEIEEKYSGLGLEPLSADFTWERFSQAIAGRKGALKALLINQDVIAGIGGSYSDEICFVAGVMPNRSAATLDEDEKRRLFAAIPAVLRRASIHGGYQEKPYSEQDTLTGGENQHSLVSYRKDQPCSQCGHPIEEFRVSGRKSFYCPICQK